MQRVHPVEISDVPASDLTDEQIRAAYAFPVQRPWLRANMVATLDGAIRGVDGLSNSISSPADHRVFSIARQDADVVLVGAGTIRAENYRPSRRPIAIVSSRLDLPATLRLFAEREPTMPRPIVLTTARAAANAPEHLTVSADLVPCGAEAVDLSEAVRTLHDRQLGHILCEGGPSLLSDLVSANLLDELLLTVTPILLGGDAGEHILHVVGGLDPQRRLSIVEVLQEAGTVFMRARRS